MQAPIRICQRTELGPEATPNQAKGFVLTHHQAPLDILVVRQRNAYFAYLNQCPHTGVNLNWLPDVFLDYSDQLIQCSTHGALFQIEDGLCIYGPCVGARLKALDLRVEPDALYLYWPQPKQDVAG